MKKIINISYQEYTSLAELSAEDGELLLKAREITKNAYAPYSHFYVGAAARLANGDVHSATNQENASFAVTMCAEQTLFMGLSTLQPEQSVTTLAVSFENKRGPSNFPISPCGKCRQFLFEFENNRFGQPIRVIMSGQSGVIRIVDSIADLLPLSFSAADFS